MFYRVFEKIKSGTFLWTTVSRVILFLHSSIASGNNKEYSNTDFGHIKNFFQNILLKTL